MKEKLTWKNNGRIGGRHNQIELIRSDKHHYNGTNSVIVRGWDCDAIATVIADALNRFEAEKNN